MGFLNFFKLSQLITFYSEETKNQSRLVSEHHNVVC